MEPLLAVILFDSEDRWALPVIKNHLQPLVKNLELVIWDKDMALLGGDKNEEKKQKLDSADIILLLISATFFNSDYYDQLELLEDTDRYRDNRCKIIPIIITDCFWEDTQIARFKPLPLNEEPIFSDDFRPSNRQLKDVAKCIKKVCSELQELKSLAVQPFLEVTNVQIKKTFNEEKIDIIRSHPNSILKSFEHASSLLQNWKSEFEKIPASHLERIETAQVIDWINTDVLPNQKGIMLLVGDAGVGKSVVMRDVLNELLSKNIPVLGIKADQYCVETIEMLEKRLNLRDGIEVLVKTLSKTHNRVVVLIDQIDALSQSLSARREYIETFTRLVLLLSEISAVRIVISCRTYDLQNDHDFSFYRKQKEIKIGKLTAEEVMSVLQKLSNEIPKLPIDLLELLKTPLHLDVFCKIYRSDLPFERIKVLRDLYHELWFQKIIESNIPLEKLSNHLEVTNLVNELSRQMYIRQNLAVPTNLFREQYSSELEYLKSSGIVFESGEGIVFFHQTFYEFVFAKQFIESDASIEDYLLENGQNLHIRSCLKMMVEFLRESDPSKYLRLLRTILESPNFYFHIKSLLLSLLGFVKKPTSHEMHLVQEVVFPNPALFKAFISSVKSHKWLLFLLQEKLIQRLIEGELTLSEKKIEKTESDLFANKMDLLNGLLLRHLPESRQEILKFISETPQFEGRQWLIERILKNIGTWDNELAFKLFDEYASRFDLFFWANFIETAAPSNYPWAFQHLKSGIEKSIKSKTSNFGEVHFSYELEELITYFVETYTESTFELLLDFQMKQMPIEGDTGNEIKKNTISNDLTFSAIDFDEIQSNRGLFSLLIDCVRILAKNQSTRFTIFIDESISSLSGTQLLILIEGLRTNISTYTNEMIRFVQVFIEKGGVDTSETLSWRARQLLREAYPFFTNHNKSIIIQIISQIESEKEKDLALKNNKPEWIGLVKLKWLKCIPENDISQIPEVKLSFYKLSKQFPDLKDREPYKVKARIIGPPLDQDKYKDMTLEEWKESFNKYDEKHESEWASPNGGMEEHARQFETEVKERPAFFYTLIEELITLSDVPKTYLIHGLNGLKEAKYEANLLLNLIKKLHDHEFKIWETIQLVSIFRYFINEEIEDDFIVNFLVKMATTNSDPADNTLKVKIEHQAVESVYASGFNTVRGSAVHLLPYLYYLKKHENLIFETLESVAEHDLISVRCQMMPRLALLTNLDQKRSLNLFLRLVRDNEEVMMKQSTWSAQYFSRQNFEGMKSYFQQGVIYPELHQDLAMILALTWIYDRVEDAHVLLNLFTEKSDKAKSGAIKAAANNIRDEEGNPISRSVELFAQFLEESGDVVIQAYDSSFQHLKPADFPHLQPTLVRFAKSVVARKKPRAFYEYLITCATVNPESCIELVEHFADYEKPTIQFSGYYDVEPIKVVINAYNEIWGRNIKDHALLKKALLLFDKMLLNDYFRRDAENVLKEVEQ